jgi:hypothetical protein
MIKTDDRKFLRHLIDVVWGHVYEDESVPATAVADELIDKAVASQINVIPGEKKTDVVIEGGYVTPLTTTENKRRLRKLRTLNFSDLKALESQCNYKMDYYHRRFPKDRKRHQEIYKEQYELWIYWFSLYNTVLLVMDEYIENLKK